jgi:hypothetical protein
VIASYACPNCGGSRVEHRDGGERAHCAFCGTDFVVPRAAPEAVPAPALRPRDVALSALGCVAIYAAVFAVASLILAAIGLQERLRPLIGAVAIIAGVTGFVLIIRRRSRP